jgi:hypothetical protein
MITVEATYNKEENGWVTKPIELTGNIYLEVKLSKDGYVVIKQQEEDTGIFKKVLVSSFCNEYKGKVFGRTAHQKIMVLTSVESSIKYENI